MQACGSLSSRGHASSFRGFSRCPAARAPVRPQQPGAKRRVQAQAAGFSPPPVADTKRKFIETYKKPLPALYDGVIQELLVQQHFIRYNVNYKYNQVFALGFVSVFDQILEGFDASGKERLFGSYIAALGEDAQQYRADASKLEAQAKELSGPEGLAPDASGNDLQRALADVAASTAAKKFSYNKFVAVGLFRLLELTGAKEPAALEKLVNAVGVRPDAVNKDLLLYKGILSKLSAAKEMMREFMERERKKQAERESAKSAKDGAGAKEEEAVPSAAPSTSG